ncbi:adenylyltransferase/sulfurtransferase MoeZ [Xylanimonas oleitrophica]|uniref:Adenylyltransferase/sulfurtransferase MoeZ n=1 Tax=Xylanimonas oleitrophica TaxID=2607479 RepID=A0A2W5WQJ1_9MICO|nr:adenylyltransferase/sulfurtransferase MoeZ [Xylanimonas oleitrophica]
MLPPLVEPGAALPPARRARYARHLVLPGVGEDGQRRLAAARVLVVGAGGLGSPVLLYLAAAGVGTLGVVDDDVVDVSNLQRQVLHGVGDVGRPKTASARARLEDVNPDVEVVEHRRRLTLDNALDLLSGYDLVVDGSDAFATRYLVSDAAEVLGMPCVWGAVHRFTGHVSTFWARPPAGVGVTYRDLFPSPPPPGTSPDCAAGGVLGAMCGTVGSLMATEAVKLLTGAGRTLLGRLAVYDALEATWRQLAVRPDPARPPVHELPEAVDGLDLYAAHCGAAAPTAPITSVRELAGLRAGGGAPFVLDVREPWEAEAAPFHGAHLVPSGELGPGCAEGVRRVAALAAGRPVHVLCRSGARSQAVAATLRESGLDARSVEGGVLAWAREVESSAPAR